MPAQVLILKDFKDMPADELTVEFWMRSTGERGMPVQCERAGMHSSGTGSGSCVRLHEGVGASSWGRVGYACTDHVHANAQCAGPPVMPPCRHVPQGRAV